MTTIKLAAGAMLSVFIVVVAAGRSPFSQGRAPRAAGTPIAENASAKGLFPGPRLGESVLGLAVSGGGSRAAYLAAAILRESHRSHLALAVAEPRVPDADLLDQFDFVSSVSGGSLAAAYFVLNRERLRADADSPAWREFMDKMALDYRLRQWYRLGLLNPRTWVRALAGGYSRGDIARADYDDVLYHGATLADLPERPVLYINSFDVSNHVRFVFSRHFLDNAAYRDRSYDSGRSKIGLEHPLLGESDVGYAKLDSSSIRVADAVYACSAVPFLYPALALNDFSGETRAGSHVIFLADGVLADDSGLLTLLTQIKYWSDRSTPSRFVLGIYVDASLDGLDNDGRDYERESTYVGQGIDTVNSALAAHQYTVMTFLQGTGVKIAGPGFDYGRTLSQKPAGYFSAGGDPPWPDEFCSGKLLLAPGVVALRLPDVPAAYEQIRLSGGARSPRLAKLLRPAGVAVRPDGRLADPAELVARLSRIRTDFILAESDRRLLDLSAYVLVHGVLEPALARWSEAARGVLERDGVSPRSGCEAPPPHVEDAGAGGVDGAGRPAHRAEPTSQRRPAPLVGYRAQFDSGTAAP